MGLVSKKGKKNRKIGRTDRSPSHQLYNQQERWIKNKARKIAKHLKKFPKYKPFNVDFLTMAFVKKLLAGQKI